MEKIQIAKNLDVRLRKVLAKEGPMLDVRLYVYNERTGYNGPTARGFLVPPNQIRNFINVLEEMEKEML